MKIKTTEQVRAMSNYDKYDVETPSEIKQMSWIHIEEIDYLIIPTIIAFGFGIGTIAILTDLVIEIAYSIILLGLISMSIMTYILNKKRVSRSNIEANK